MARVSDLSAVVSDIVWHLTAGHTLHTHCTGPGGGTDHRWRSSTSVARAQARRLVTAKLTLWNSRQLIRLCYLTHFTTKTRFIKYRVSSNYKIGPLWQVWSSLRSMKMRSEKFWVWILHKFVYGRVWLMVVGCGWVVQLLLFSFNFLEMVQCELQPAPGTVVMVTITHSLRSRHAAALIIFHIILLLAELSGACSCSPAPPSVRRDQQEIRRTTECAD